jgi:type II secretory pathway pseudopilin PulG
MKGRHLPKRTAAGFTVLEITLVLGILLVAMVLVAQAGFASMRDRVRNAARHQAEELAANVLEAARAFPWETLTPEWAAGQRLPEGGADRLLEGRMTVKVAPEPGRPLVKRVTVTISWTQDGDKPARPVELVGLFAARTTTEKGGKP